MLLGRAVAVPNWIVPEVRTVSQETGPLGSACGTDLLQRGCYRDVSLCGTTRCLGIVDDVVVAPTVNVNGVSAGQFGERQRPVPFQSLTPQHDLPHRGVCRRPESDHSTGTVSTVLSAKAWACRYERAAVTVVSPENGSFRRLSVNVPRRPWKATLSGKHSAVGVRRLDEPLPTSSRTPLKRDFTLPFNPPSPRVNNPQVQRSAVGR